MASDDGCLLGWHRRNEVLLPETMFASFMLSVRDLYKPVGLPRTEMYDEIGVGIFYAAHVHVPGKERIPVEAHGKRAELCMVALAKVLNLDEKTLKTIRTKYADGPVPAAERFAANEHHRGAFQRAAEQGDRMDLSASALVHAYVRIRAACTVPLGLVLRVCAHVCATWHMCVCVLCVCVCMCCASACAAHVCVCIHSRVRVCTANVAFAATGSSWSGDLSMACVKTTAAGCVGESWPSPR